MTSPTTDRRQGLVGNTPIKAPVDCATTGPITLSGEQVIDGVQTAGSRVLVLYQTDATQNGIYDSSTAAWTRSFDSDGNYDLTTGTMVYCIGGTANGSNFFQVSAPKPITVGSTLLTWARTLFSSSAVLAFIQGVAGAISDTLQAKNRERISVLDFIPPAMKPAILNYTSTDDHTPYILAAFAACGGRELIVPSGKYNHHELTYAKTQRFHLRGDMSGYDNTVGAVWNFTPTGTSIGLQIGVDDGSPDATGPIRDVVVEGITFSTATGATAIRVQNTGLCRIERNSFNLFSGKVIDCRGNVLLKIRDNDIRGSQPASGNYGIWLDFEYFGNFVTEIAGNHIYQLNWAIRFSQGRSVKVIGNTFENIKGWTVANPGFGGMFLFATSGYISEAIFENNYCESQRGWCFYSDPLSPFSGAILNLILRGNEFWGSGDATNQNPGFGNLPRNKVMSQEIDSNYIVEASMNTNAFLALPANSYFPSTTIFDTTTTAVIDQVVGKEYEDALVYALNGKDLMKANGDLAMITGGTPGSLSVNGSSVPSINGAATSPPSGWTASGIITGSVWNAILDAITGGWVCFCPGSGTTFNTAQITLTITSNPATTYYTVAFTAKGWAALKLNGSSIYDPGSNIANYNTQVITFSIPPSTTTFNLTLATNGANPSYWAEMRVFPIGIAEYTSPGPGALNGLLVKAVKRLMRRGAY